MEARDFSRVRLHNSGMLYSSFDTLIWLFEEIKPIFMSRWNCVYNSGICISNTIEFCERVRDKFSTETETVYSAWLKILYNLSEDIDTMFRYGASDLGDDVIF